MRLLAAVVGGALASLVVTESAAALTYFVSPTGLDTHTPIEAQNPATPWRTINHALLSALSGDTVSVAPGTYTESVESKRDGAATAPIVIKSAAVGQAIVDPPPGQPGFYISHNHHVVDGFTVTGSTIGIRVGAHDNGGQVVGNVIVNNAVFDNTSNGIQVVAGAGNEIAFNDVHDNGSNGISYSGDNSLIHDNVADHNGQFGIYVKDGMGHVVYDNTARNNAQADLQIVGLTAPTPAGTYYVNCQAGDDSRTATQAKNPATPWRTIAFALASADAGDTVTVVGGTPQAPILCNEPEIVSKRAGAPGAAITIRAATPGSVIVRPPVGNGFRIKPGHDFHAIEGFVVSGVTGNGIQVQANGVFIGNNRIEGNNLAGIKVSDATGVAIWSNVIAGNGKHGIVYDTGHRADIFNNLLYRNGSNEGWAIQISSGSGHRVSNNTVWDHNAGGSGGIKLGTALGTPVYSTVINNIVVGNRVGIKEPAGEGYVGIAKLEFNNVFGNTEDYDLSDDTGSVVGITTSFSLDPAFVSVDPNDPAFLRLSRVASGQAVNSPCLDAGSAAADTLGLGGATTSSDKAPDTGRVDLGYHAPLN